MPDSKLVDEIYQAIRDVPDFPKPGILFKDITPLLLSPGRFRRAVELMASPFRGSGVTRVVSIESRGFLLGAPIALALDAGSWTTSWPRAVPRRRRPSSCARMGRKWLALRS